MADLCPGCGAPSGLEAHAARVLSGTCASCGTTFTIVQDPLPGDSAGSPEASGGIAPAGRADGSGTRPSAGPPCSSCGEPLEIRSASETSLEAHCASCDTLQTYVLAAGPAAEAEGGFRRRGAGRPERPRFGEPRGRPCRECGGPLRFSTDAEGNVTGECNSCGNRFTLPPRPAYGGRDGGGGGRRGPPGRFGPSNRRPGRWPRQAEGDRPPRFRQGGPPFRRRSRPQEDEDGEDDRPRRRRPR